jgi:hypothetical protein
MTKRKRFTAEFNGEAVRWLSILWAKVWLLAWPGPGAGTD